MADAVARGFSSFLYHLLSIFRDLNVLRYMYTARRQHNISAKGVAHTIPNTLIVAESINISGISSIPFLHSASNSDFLLSLIA